MSGETVQVLGKENVCAVIVTYNPTREFKDNLIAILAIAKEIMIVDNGSKNLFEIQEWVKGFDHIHLIVNKDNEGIAKALNKGMMHAVNGGYEWVYTFDQDSSPSPKLLDYHRAIIDSIPDKDRIAMIGTKHTEQVCKGEDTIHGHAFEEVKVTITSGSIMNTTVFLTVGPFRESFFIDAVDHEYCLRARKNGYKVYETTVPLLTHKIGNNSVHKFLFWTPMTSNHSLERRYYMFRNNMILNKEYLFQEPRWVMQNSQTITRVALYMLLFEKNKWLKLVVLLRGLYDGVLNKEGKLDSIKK